MSGEDTWNKDMQEMVNREMNEKLSNLNNQEKHTVGALLTLAETNNVAVDKLDLEALKKIAAETSLTDENLTEEQRELIKTVYDKLPPSPQWKLRGGYKKTRKRRRKSRKKTNKKRKKKRKKKTNKKRRYKHTGGNKCKCCKCCKKRKPKKKSRKRR